VRAELLAEAIPALSFATGANPVPKAFGSAGNIDLMTLKDTAWPRQSGRWLHGDIVNIGYLYTYGFYDDVVKKGGF
jgi:hypothetical protein